MILMPESTSQTVQVGEQGVVTLPKEVREKYGIEEGDALHLVDLGDGMFVVSPMMPAVPSLVEEIEGIRKEEGVSLEDLLAGLQKQREQLTREVYGPDPETDERSPQ